jgi:hypothetical protein
MRYAPPVADPFPALPTFPPSQLLTFFLSRLSPLSFNLYPIIESKIPGPDLCWKKRF